ncbi:MAG: hypothetical protein IK008_04845 [Bacteroidales bacterium]|nr:hypothetical protein [Bacteroidales bacterium]
MKKIISVFCAISLISAVALAQPGNGKKGDKDAWQERVRIEQISYISSELNLTQEEAQTFWPVFNDVQNKSHEAFKASSEAFRALQEADDSNVAERLDAYVKAKNQANKVNEEAVEQYKKVLPVEKVAKLLVAEENFRRNQIGKLGGKGGHGKGGPGKHGGPRPGGFPGAPQMDE